MSCLAVMQSSLATDPTILRLSITTRVYLRKSPACRIGITLLNIGSLKVDPETPRLLANPQLLPRQNPLSLPSHSQQKYIKCPSFPAICSSEAGDDLVKNFGRVPDPVIFHAAHSVQHVDKTRPVRTYYTNPVKGSLGSFHLQRAEPRTTNHEPGQGQGQGPGPLHLI